jgi:hypothetical protein
MRAFALGFLLLAAGPALAADKYVGSVAEVRTILNFKAADAAVQKLLPEGWELDVATSGPAKDVNLVATFLDQLASQDAGGKELNPVRAVTLTIPAKKSESDIRRRIVFAIYLSSPAFVPGPYGVNVYADTKMERTVRIDSTGASAVDESWQFQASDGNSIQLQIEYIRGAPAPEKYEELIYSAAKPDFYRIYRVERSADEVRGDGFDRVRKIAIKGSGPKLGSLFDGSERLSGVTSVPWYTRRVYLPGS